MLTTCQALLGQVDETVDPYQAHALAASAIDVIQRVSGAPDEVGDILTRAAQKLDQIDRTVPVEPAMAVRLGPSGTNVVDLAVGDIDLGPVSRGLGKVDRGRLGRTDDDRLDPRPGAVVAGHRAPRGAPMGVPPMKTSW